MILVKLLKFPTMSAEMTFGFMIIINDFGIFLDLMIEGFKSINPL